MTLENMTIINTNNIEILSKGQQTVFFQIFNQYVTLLGTMP